MSDDDSRQYADYSAEASEAFLADLIKGGESHSRLNYLHQMHFGKTAGMGTIAKVSRAFKGKSKPGLSLEEEEWLTSKAASLIRFGHAWREFQDKFREISYSAFGYHWKIAKAQMRRQQEVSPIRVNANNEIHVEPRKDGSLVLPADMFEANSLEEDRTEALRDSVYARMLSLGIRRFQIWDDGRCEAEFVKSVRIGAKTYE